MKQPHFLLKVTVIASSVLLVAAFVCYRADAFGLLSVEAETNRGATNLPSGENRQYAEIVAEFETLFPAADPVQYSTRSPTLMSGSKALVKAISLPRVYLSLEQMFNLPEMNWHYQPGPTQRRFKKPTMWEASQ